MSGGNNVGIRDLPGFEPSLRLLIEREQYSIADIALMFGVSHQRINQLIGALSIHVPQYPRGVRAVRAWDDKTHRFVPVGREAWNQGRHHLAGLRRERERDNLVAERRRRITTTLHELCTTLGRDPSWREMATALGGGSIQHTRCAMFVIKAWRSSGVSTAVALKSFRAETGIVARPRGGRGHVGPRKRSVVGGET